MSSLKTPAHPPWSKQLREVVLPWHNYSHNQSTQILDETMTITEHRYVLMSKSLTRQCRPRKTSLPQSHQLSQFTQHESSIEIFSIAIHFRSALPAIHRQWISNVFKVLSSIWPHVLQAVGQEIKLHLLQLLLEPKLQRQQHSSSIIMLHLSSSPETEYG